MALIALATAVGADEISKDDVLLAEALAYQGLEAETRPWSDPTADWSRYQAVIVRTTWDYHLHLAKFLDWTTEVAAVTSVWNPPSLMAWNARKAYLEELSAKGVPIVPTLVVRTAADLERLESTSDGPWVVKPEIGASAMDAQVHDRHKAAIAHAGSLLKVGLVLVQPFQASVLEEGEISIVWIGGEVVHAVRKLPMPGDFRVQVEYGGVIERIEVPEEGEAIAKNCMAAIEPGALFARVDIVRDDEGVFRLMELELIEPELMFEWAPESASKLAETIAKALERN